MAAEKNREFSSARADAIDIWRSGVDAVNSERLIASHVSIAGRVLTICGHSFSLDDVRNPKADAAKNSRATHLGRPGNAAGDPGTIAVTPNRVAIAFSGVGDISVARDLKQPFKRVSVGRRPEALAIARDGRRIFVADRFSDSISIVDAEQAQRKQIDGTAHRAAKIEAVGAQKTKYP